MRYARSGAVEVAYEIVGAGPIDLVYVPGFISHLDLYREIPSFLSVIEHLARFARVLLFDKRGTGLSSRVGFGSISDRADDIRVVMDHAGWERANVMAVSENMLGILLAGGVDPQRAAWAIDALSLIITANAVETVIWQERDAAGEPDAYDHDTLIGAFASLPADRFPNLVEHASVLVSGDQRDRFAFQIDTFIDGLVR